MSNEHKDHEQRLDAAIQLAGLFLKTIREQRAKREAKGNRHKKGKPSRTN